MKRRIAVITGTRAEYGLLKPIMDRIKASAGLELLTLVTGMHLSPEHGETVKLIEKDKFRITAKVDMLLGSNSSGGMVKSLGIGVYGLAQALEMVRPDIVLVLGDRTEAFAGAIAATYLNLPVAHVHGGDRGKGDIDERVRHAITKLSHLHFPASRLSAERIIKLGECGQYVFTVGAPGLDTIIGQKIKTKEKMLRDLGLAGLKNSPYFLVLQNPVTTEPDLSYEQMSETLAAMSGFDEYKIIIRPNSDAGHTGINQAIDEYRNDRLIKVFSNVKRDDYLCLMKHAAALVGNSSSGIIEAPLFGLPVINLGVRQAGRERSANVIDATHDRQAISKALKRALYDQQYRRQAANCRNPYGYGHASERIVRILAKIKLDKDLLQKQIAY